MGFTRTQSKALAKGMLATVKRENGPRTVITITVDADASVTEDQLLWTIKQKLPHYRVSRTLPHQTDERLIDQLQGAQKAVLERSRHIDDLRNKLDELQAQNRVLGSRLRETVEDLDRPTITLEQAAANACISMSSAYRYVAEGFWRGYRDKVERRWKVFADQPLSRKRI